LNDVPLKVSNAIAEAEQAKAAQVNDINDEDQAIADIHESLAKITKLENRRLAVKSLSQELSQPERLSDSLPR
jgi:hypothetical protein